MDERVQRRGGDEAATEEALRQGHPREDRTLAEGTQRVTCREPRRTFPGLGAQAGQGDRARDTDHAGDRDRARPTEAVGEEATSERGERGSRRTAHPDEAQDTPTQPRGVHRAPQAQMERTTERQADPEHHGDGDHRDRRGQQEQQHERCGAGRTDEGELSRGARPEPASEGAQEVRHERRGGERREAERLQPATASDGGQQRTDERGRHADADRGGQVERQVAPDGAPGRRGDE